MTRWSGWNLPPGCFDADIERAMGEDEPGPCDACDNEGCELCDDRDDDPRDPDRAWDDHG